MPNLNYHHLHYFWAVAKEGNLTRAALRLNVSQSALSTQIKQLEAQLGQTLFDRVGRTLALTEAGHLALAHAETIFATGNELLALLRGDSRAQVQVLRIGAVATLSRNFQENFVKPLLGRDDVSLTLQSSSLSELLSRLRVHSIDLVLSNRRVHGSSEDPWRCRRIARQPVSLVGQPRGRRKAFRFPDELAEVPLLLPGQDNDIRAAFDLMCEQRNLHYRLRAEVDDMACCACWRATPTAWHCYPRWWCKMNCAADNWWSTAWCLTCMKTSMQSRCNGTSRRLCSRRYSSNLRPTC